MSLLNNCDTRSTGGGSDENLHAPVFQVVVSVDSLLCVMLVILEVIVDLISVDSACLVDLVNCDLNTVLYSISVDSSAAGNRAGSADLKCVAS